MRPYAPATALIICLLTACTPQYQVLMPASSAYLSHRAPPRSEPVVSQPAPPNRLSSGNVPSPSPPLVAGKRKARGRLLLPHPAARKAPRAAHAATVLPTLPPDDVSSLPPDTAASRRYKLGRLTARADYRRSRSRRPVPAVWLGPEPVRQALVASPDFQRGCADERKALKAEELAQLYIMGILMLIVVGGILVLGAFNSMMSSLISFR